MLSSCANTVLRNGIRCRIELADTQQIFAAPIRISDPRERNYLQAVIEQKKPATMWFTLSFADNHWQDCLRLLGDPPPDIVGDKAINAWYHKQAKLNPALFNELFVTRVQRFVDEFFG